MDIQFISKNPVQPFDCNNNDDDDDDDDLLQVTQIDLDAGLVENFATVNATSSIGAAASQVEKDVEIQRVSSLIVGEPHRDVYFVKRSGVVFALKLEHSNSQHYRSLTHQQPVSIPIVEKMGATLTKPSRPWPHATSCRNYLVKTGTAIDAGTDGVVSAGDVVTISFEVTNTGDTCLAVASFVDDDAGMVDCPYVMDMAGEKLSARYVLNL